MKVLIAAHQPGPLKGGSHGPYIQSQRRQLYTQRSDQLLENGHAYRCFCTPQRLEQVRERARLARSQPKYDGKCRHLPKEEIDKLLEAKMPHTIRLKVPLKGSTHFSDLVHGKIEFGNRSLDDLILMKSDGWPTYHLANVVDDHDMRISMVVRGEVILFVPSHTAKKEWVSSTPKHILLYNCFGWKPPQFAHLPLLTNQDGSKLSKRQGDITLEWLRASLFRKSNTCNRIKDIFLKHCSILWLFSDGVQALQRNFIRLKSSSKMQVVFLATYNPSLTLNK